MASPWGSSISDTSSINTSPASSRPRMSSCHSDGSLAPVERSGPTFVRDRDPLGRVSLVAGRPGLGPARCLPVDHATPGSNRLRRHRRASFRRRSSAPGRPDCRWRPATRSGRHRPPNARPKSPTIAIVGVFLPQCRCIVGNDQVAVGFQTRTRRKCVVNPAGQLPAGKLDRCVQIGCRARSTPRLIPESPSHPWRIAVARGRGSR